MPAKTLAPTFSRSCAPSSSSFDSTMPSYTGGCCDPPSRFALLTKRCSDQIRENVLVKQYYCDVDIAHLISYNEELAHRLTTQPTDIIPLVRSRKSVERIPHQLIGYSSKQRSNNAPTVLYTPRKSLMISNSLSISYSSTPLSPRSPSATSMRLTSPTLSAYPASSSVHRPSLQKPPL